MKYITVQMLEREKVCARGIQRFREAFLTDKVALSPANVEKAILHFQPWELMLLAQHLRLDTRELRRISNRQRKRMTGLLEDYKKGARNYLRSYENPLLNEALSAGEFKEGKVAISVSSAILAGLRPHVAKCRKKWQEATVKASREAGLAFLKAMETYKEKK